MLYPGYLSPIQNENPRNGSTDDCISDRMQFERAIWTQYLAQLMGSVWNVHLEEAGEGLRNPEKP